MLSEHHFRKYDTKLVGAKAGDLEPGDYILVAGQIHKVTEWPRLFKDITGVFTQWEVKASTATLYFEKHASVDKIIRKEKQWT